jgi:hypothetical protein
MLDNWIIEKFPKLIATKEVQRFFRSREVTVSLPLILSKIFEEFIAWLKKVCFGNKCKSFELE